MATVQEIRAELNRRARDVKIELAIKSFYGYCQVTSPDFYLDDRPHLEILANTLQRFYECKLIRADGYVYKKLMIQMPPRHGKTRTLTKFSAWVLGKNKKHKTISAAFNDILATDFSKFTRDEIKEEKISRDEIVYSDMFPGSKIKRGSSGVMQWALEGTHFSYKGSGVGGTITGKGGNLLLIDDPVKDADTAFNEAALDKLWIWYTGTWLSRKESGALEIITHTPWAKKDISGRLMDGETSDEWYLLSMPACVDHANKKMLCESILSYQEYVDLKRLMEPLIFAANYDMIRLDKHGMMYSEFIMYDKLPDFENEFQHQGKIMVTDTAGKGKDYLCSIYGYAVDEYFYVFDVEYTQADIDITESEAARKIVEYKLNIADIESNSAGHSWAHHVEQECKKKWKWFGTTFLEKPQTKNKEARIFTNRIEVNRRIVFPFDWRYRWPDFYNDVMTFPKDGKAKHDDAPDTLTRVVEFLDENLGGIVLPKRDIV